MLSDVSGIYTRRHPRSISVRCWGRNSGFRVQFRIWGSGFRV